MNRKLKVLFISESFPPYANGGAGVSTSLIVKAINNKCDCRILTQKFNNEKPWKFEGFDVLPTMNNYSPNFNSPWKFARSLSRNIFYRKIFRIIKKQIKDFQPDIIHLQINHYGLMRKIISLNISTVIDIRDSQIGCPIMFRGQECNNLCNKRCKSNLKRYFEKKYSNKWFIKIFSGILSVFVLNYHKQSVYKLVEKINNSHNIRIVSLSDYIKGILILAGIRNDKIETIRNISDLLNIKQIKKKNQIIFAGSIDSSKGVFTIIEAMRILNNRNLKGILLGDGPELKKCKDLVNKYFLNIDFLGKVSNKKVLELYSESKIIIAPSVWPEPFGRFIQEGISTKTPVIATRVGGIPEGIKDHKSGLLVEPNNPKQLARAIKELLTDKKLYDKIVRNLEKEADKYSPETIGKQRLDLYYKLLKQNETPNKTKT